MRKCSRCKQKKDKAKGERLYKWQGMLLCEECLKAVKRERGDKGITQDMEGEAFKKLAAKMFGSPP